jgi:hypothetical protein
MLEVFAIVILFGSLAGMGLIVIRKISILAELSSQEIQPGPVKRLSNKIRDKKTLKFLSKDIILQKALSKIRILTLKTDNKADSLLIKLRQKSRKERNDFSDGYWKKVNSLKNEPRNKFEETNKSRDFSKTNKKSFPKT